MLDVLFQYFSTFTTVISMFNLSGHVCHFEINFVMKEGSYLDLKNCVDGSRQLLKKCLIGTFEMVLFCQKYTNCLLLFFLYMSTSKRCCLQDFEVSTKLVYN